MTKTTDTTLPLDGDKTAPLLNDLLYSVHVAEHALAREVEHRYPSADPTPRTGRKLSYRTGELSYPETIVLALADRLNTLERRLADVRRATAEPPLVVHPALTGKLLADVEAWQSVAEERRKHERDPAHFDTWDPARSHLLDERRRMHGGQRRSRPWWSALRAWASGADR